MYEYILKDQLKKLQECQRKCMADPAEFVRLSSVIQETARKLENITHTTLEAEIELSCPVQKEELLEDFSNEELVRELEKRGAANIHRTDDKNLFVFTGNFYTD